MFCHNQIYGLEGPKGVVMLNDVKDFNWGEWNKMYGEILESEG
jgi:hypothetical protein